MSSPGDRARTAVGGVMVVAVAAVGVAWAAHDSADARRSHTSTDGDAQTSSPPHASAVPVLPATRAGAPRAEVPTRSVLPNGAVVPIRPVGTASDGRLSVPEDIGVAGWWRGGARLGDPFGSTLLAAHVDSTTQGLGPYASLLSVTPGRRIILSSSHLSQTYAVVALSLVPRDELSTHPRIFSARGPRRLTLVTCAGPYDASRGGYQNLAVITARPVQDAVVRRGAG